MVMDYGKTIQKQTSKKGYQKADKEGRSDF
jgi:hypothetical protein